MRRTRWFPALALAATFLAACGDGDPAGPGPETGLFDRYVALGNSITAGYESEGVNDSTQNHAYPVLLAERVGASFRVAPLNRPGCPPPLVGPVALTSERVDGAASGSCAGIGPVPNPIQSLAVPGFRIADAFQVPGGAIGFVYALVFGSRSLVEHMIDQQPTLVSVWLGNNDALGAALQADLGLLTPAAAFADRVEALARAIEEETGARDAIWLSIIDPQLAPALQPGAYLWGLAQDSATASLLPKPVSEDCAPFQPAGEANARASHLVSLAVGRDPAVTQISCEAGAPYVLDSDAQATVSARVALFNDAIAEAAASRGWIFIDVNALTEEQLQDPDRLRKCQGLLAAGPEEFLDTLRSTCPHPDALHFFGSLLSFDGVHPSRAGQELVVDAIAAALQQRYGHSL